MSNKLQYLPLFIYSYHHSLLVFGRGLLRFLDQVLDQVYLLDVKSPLTIYLLVSAFWLYTVYTGLQADTMTCMLFGSHSTRRLSKEVCVVQLQVL